MKGFSIIEIVIVVAVIAILAAAALGSFSSLRGTQELVKTDEEIISLIKSAREKTLFSEGASQYGVHFESSRLVLFKGTTFSDADPNNIVMNMSSLLEISFNLNGGGSDLVFQRLTGKTDNYGTITVRIKANPSNAKTIIILSTGVINAS